MQRVLDVMRVMKDWPSYDGTLDFLVRHSFPNAGAYPPAPRERDKTVLDQGSKLGVGMFLVDRHNEKHGG